MRTADKKRLDFMKISGLSLLLAAGPMLVSIAVSVAMPVRALGAPKAPATPTKPATPTAITTAKSLALQNIDPKNTYLSYEATFQNEAMLSDKALTMKTDPKFESFNKMIESFKRLPQGQGLVLTKDRMGDFKPGLVFSTPSGESIHTTMEPGCVEWTLSPKTVFELKKAWTPIYQAASRAGLEPYIMPGARGSGGGQFHVGGTSIELNPIVKNPLLLRNLFVFMNQHPAALYAFSEAFDSGANGNARNYHNADQKAFAEAISIFDNWYDQNKSSKASHEIVAKFFEVLLARVNASHYYTINLDNMAYKIRHMTGNVGFTVEFRNIRPMPTAKHVEAMGVYLLKLMDHLAVPEYRVPMKTFDPVESNRMFSSLVVEEDWNGIKRTIGLENRLMDELVHEYTRNPFLEAKEVDGGLLLRQTYSEGERIGQNYELIKPLGKKETAPDSLRYNSTDVPVQVVTIDGQRFAVGVYADDLRAALTQYAQMNSPVLRCEALFR